MQLELFNPESPSETVTVSIEEWKEIPEFPTYEVSSMGRFRRKKDMLYMTGTCSNNGYMHVGFTVNGKQQFRLSHRMVAQAFLIPPSEHHIIVNHINHVRHDNRLSNLEWATRSWNAKHAKMKVS